jgi:hypothetical protein
MHQIQIQTKPSQLLIKQINQGTNHLVSHKQNARSQTRWPADIKNVGQVNDEGLPLNNEISTRLSRVCGLATRQRMSLTLERFKNSIQAYVEYLEELK